MFEILEGIVLIGISIAVGALLFIRARATNYQWPRNTMVINLMVLFVIATGVYGIALELAEIGKAVD